MRAGAAFLAGPAPLSGSGTCVGLGSPLSGSPEAGGTLRLAAFLRGRMGGASRSAFGACGAQVRLANRPTKPSPRMLGCKHTFLPVLCVMPTLGACDTPFARGPAGPGTLSPLGCRTAGSLPASKSNADVGAAPLAALFRNARGQDCDLHARSVHLARAARMIGPSASTRSLSAHPSAGSHSPPFPPPACSLLNLWLEINH